MKRRQKVWGITLTLSGLLLSGCSQSTQSAIEINSANATSITATEVAKYSRVVALANGSAEIISALGQKKILVGRDIASTDSDLKSVPVVTSGHQVVPEKILALKPDLVLIDASTGPATALNALTQAGANVVKISESWAVGEIPAKVNGIAHALAIDSDGKRLSDAITNSSAKISKPARVAFLYLRGGSAIYLIGGKGSGADSIIESIGGTDIGAAKLTNPFNTMTAEAMATLNPDLILVMSKGLESVGGVKGLVALPGVAQTSAGKKGRIVAVDDSLLLSFGPRTADLQRQLAAAIDKVMAQ